MAILDDVKTALTIVGNHADAALNLHIDTVKNYLLNAGISENTVENGKSNGAIIRGVCDLWNTNSGGISFSPVFYDLVIQIALSEDKGGSEDGSTVS